MDSNHPRYHNDGEAHLQDCPVCIHGFTTELHLRRHLLEHVLNCHREAEVQQGASGLHINISNIQLPYGETLLQSSLRPKRVPRKRISRATGGQRRRQGTTPTVQYVSPPWDDGDEDWEPDTGYGDYNPTSRETPAKPKTSSETKQFQCSVCKAVFSDRQTCKTHIQTHIATSSAGIAIACPRLLDTGVLPTEQFRCSICKEAFSDSRACWTHVQTHIVRSDSGILAASPSGTTTAPVTGGQPSLCAVCKEMFSDSQECRAHVLTHIHKSTKPDVTAATTLRPTTAAPSVGIISGVQTKQFRCGVCRDIFTDREVCQTHIQTHIKKSAGAGLTANTPSNELLRCGVCKEMFSDQQVYQAHVQTHSQKWAPSVTAVPAPGVVTSGLATEQFRCFICSDVLPDREACQTHIKTHLQKGVTEPTPLDIVPDGPQIKRLRCGVCKATFRGRHVCQTAMQTSSQESTVPGPTAPPSGLGSDSKEFRCSVCAMLFHNRKSCVEHTAQHSVQPTTQHTKQHTMPQTAHHTAMPITKHTSVHTPQFTPQAMTCEKRPTPVSLIKASQPTEVVSSLLCCGDCGAVFDEKHFYEEHIQTHNAKSTTSHPHPCPPQSTQMDSVKLIKPHPQPGPQRTQADAKLASVESQELYRCSVCKKIFDDKLSCEKHMGSHTLRTPTESQAKSSLLRDILTRTSDQIKIATQTPVKLYRCSSCKEIFKDIESCKRHTATQHLKPVTCMLCDKGCSSKADLLLHIDTVHPQKTLSKQDRKAGQQTLKVAPFNTIEKTPTVRQSRALLTSILPVGGNAELSPDVDTTNATVKSDKMSAVGSVQDVDMEDEETDSREEFDDSKIITNADVTKKPSAVSSLKVVHTLMDEECHECDVCGKCLKSKIGLEGHLESHPACSECGQKFKSKSLLSNHQQAVHKSSCKVCCATFKTPAALTLHMKCHKGTEWPPKCGECGKVFKTERYLTIHMVVHTKAYACVCEICGAGFRIASRLASHMQTHLQERKHKCEVCGRGFNDKYVMQGHMRVHTGEKPYVCHRCGKAFRERTTLRKHLERVSCHHRKNYRPRADDEPTPESAVPEQVFPCEICLDAFTTRTALTRHQKTCTPSEPEQD